LILLWFSGADLNFRKGRYSLWHDCISSCFGGLQFTLGAFHGPNSPQKHRMLIDFITRLWTNGKKKPAISNGFCTSLDCIGGGSLTDGLSIWYVYIIQSLRFACTPKCTPKIQFVGANPASQACPFLIFLNSLRVRTILSFSRSNSIISGVIPSFSIPIFRSLCKIVCRT